MERSKLLDKKWFIYLTGFFSGMSIMAVELGASRLLAPYFSSSQIVWTIIIGTIMIALAIGNVVGGRLADKKPNPDRIYYLLIIAGVWIAAIPFLGKYLIALISIIFASFIGTNFLIWASFTSCMIIFVFPLILLGMITPTLMKLAVKNLDDNGKTVGELEALNTIGSIIGTFLPTFLTIPTIGTAYTFIIFAFILFVIGLIYFITVRRKLVRCAILGVIAVIMSIFGVNGKFAFFQNNVFEGESIYNYLRVEETNSKIILSTNVLFGVQSVKMKEDRLTGMYFEYGLAAPVMADVYQNEETDILVLGLGTGTFPTLCLKYFDNVNIEGVEIDREIVDLAKEYFDLPEEVKTIVSDGRAYLNESGEYDVIFVDAYQDITIPFQMSSIEFFEMVKLHLSDNGIMAVNMNMYSSEEDSINEYLCDTIREVFPNAYIVTTGSNRMVYASCNDNILSKLSANKDYYNDVALESLMERIETKAEVLEKGNKILTDDKAPVELLGMKVLDEMISKQLASIQTDIKGKTIKELIEKYLK